MMEKTEFIVFGTFKQLEKVTDITVQLGSELIKPVKKVCNLGFFMDCLMKNHFQVTRLMYKLSLPFIISKALEDTSTDT